MLSISLGPFSIPTSTALSILFITVFLTTAFLLSRAQDDQKRVTDSVFNAVIIGFITARLVFVISFWEIYQQSWLSIIDIRDGGFKNSIGWIAGVTVLVVSNQGQRSLMKHYIKASLLALTVVLPLYVVNTLSTQNKTYSDIVITDNNVMGEFEGRPLVINIWASWCPPCRREMPVLEAAQNENRHIQFVFLNQQEAPSRVQQYLSKNALYLDNIFFDFMGEASARLGAFGLPTTLFFDANGKLIATHIGELSSASLAYYLEHTDLK